MPAITAQTQGRVVAPRPALVACADCDLLQRLGPIPAGGDARCCRCGGVLRRSRPDGIERTLAMTLAAAVLFAVANSFPFLDFDMKGQVTQTTLLTGVRDLNAQGMPELAVLVLLTSVLAPMAQISLLLHLLVPLHWKRRPWQMARAFRLLRHVQTWSMMEVFLIGILVSVVKLAGMAQIVPGLALWAFALLILVLAGAVSSLDPEAVWERAEALR
jgi:paraquat-inducible protein A